MSNSHQQRSAVPPTEHRQPSHLNPRRQPAHRSVSLRHSPPKPALRASATSIPKPQSTVANPSTGSNSDGSPSSVRPLVGRGSSGESSNADRWFDQSNNDVRDNSTSYDNDPPFFMRNGSSSESPLDGQGRLHQYLGHNGTQSLPHRPGMLRMGTDGGSSTEDFRSVIDDLTVENKKLRRRLKKYEKLHDAHLKNDKLFEIRIHGLEADKKRELEELLRNFAGSLSTQPTPEFPTNGYEGILPGLKTHQTASSQTSMQHTDSAYASISASGQGSSAPSGGDSKHRNQAQAAKSRQQNIHSFLHHIPEGLRPQTNPEAMTERAKRKLVVRRLEQIFAGTDALAGPHHQALQQQDVSHMAAYADRTTHGQQTDLEGLRESAIMDEETEDPLDIGTKKRTAPKLGEEVNNQEAENVGETDSANPSPDAISDEQRPTRPLDVDPDRAQVPADNVRYIRHLGFSPQDPEYQKTPEDGHGWVYLNLLVNMAQLHTLHVTPEFVRKAVSDFSDHFEVSDDGRKVRWKGGARVTKTSSYGGDSSRERNQEDSQSPRKKRKTANGFGMAIARANGTSQRGHATSIRRPHQELGRLMYTPLFSHRSSSEDSEMSSSAEEQDYDSPYQHQVGAESSAMASSGVRTVVAKRTKKHDTGPIIFYSNARFCTDLSGDSTMRGSIGAPNYKLPALTPVGRTPTREETGHIFEKRGPLEEASFLPEPMDLADNPIPDSLELTFPPQSPSKPFNNKPARPCVNMEVTGMGGVYPADNFAINVESRHAVVNQAEAPSVPIHNTTKNLPGRFSKILQSDNPQRKVRAAVSQNYVNIQRTEHPPSVLPPALCFVSDDDDSMSDDDSNQAENMSISAASADALPPSTAPQTMYMPDVDSEDSDEEIEDDESDADSDGSLDLLAEARKADPEAVLRKERQYDAEMAERLAEEIPAGSSAATAGGGSGFISPASGVDKRKYRKAKQEARATQQQPARPQQQLQPQPAAVPANLQRSGTSDSMNVQGLEGSTDGSTSSDSDESGS